MTKGQVYLLLGPETGEKEDFIAVIRQEIKKIHKEPPEETRIYPFETTVSDMVTDLRTGSLFGAPRLVLLKGLEEIKKKEDLSLLSQYCEKPSPGTVLVLLSDEVSADSAIKNKVPKENQKIFWELFEDRKRAWVISFLKNQSQTIENGALELLLSLVENNTQELKEVCGKLSSFFSIGYKITEDDIDAYIYHSKEENAFSLFTPLSERNLSGALEILRKILLGNDSEIIPLFAGMLWQFRRLLSLKRLTESNYSLQEGFTRLGITSKRQQKIYGTGTSNYSLSELEEIIPLLAEYDLAVRSIKSEMQLLLVQLFLYQVIIPGRKRTFFIP